jgi:hypothetical protein
MKNDGIIKYLIIEPLCEMESKKKMFGCFQKSGRQGDPSLFWFEDVVHVVHEKHMVFTHLPFIDVGQ